METSESSNKQRVKPKEKQTVSTKHVMAGLKKELKKIRQCGIRSLRDEKYIQAQITYNEVYNPSQEEFNTGV
jgi:hypothetical protein